MDWGLIWEFAGVAIAVTSLVVGFIWRGIAKLESRIHANETDISQFKERLGILEVRQAQALLMQTSLDKFGDKLDGVATKLEVVADRLDRISNGAKE